MSWSSCSFKNAPVLSPPLEKSRCLWRDVCGSGLQESQRGGYANRSGSLPILFLAVIRVVFGFWRSGAASEHGARIVPLGHRSTRHGLHEREDDSYSGEDVEDGEELASGGSGHEIAISDRRERDGAEVEGVKHAPFLHIPVESGPGGEGQNDETEERPELGIPQPPSDGAGKSHGDKGNCQPQQDQRRDEPDHSSSFPLFVDTVIVDREPDRSGLP